ncbi:MAG: M28 family peptidase [Planctomycetes bacterium]|nr:M28 family peptidase [Planctomycetota bacterium]
MTHRHLAAFLSVLLPAAPLVRAQAPTITEEAVRTTVSWLAADERAGRDTGSPELVATGEWIAERFAKAGLQKVADNSWYHEFPLPGHVLDSKAVKLTLVRQFGDEQKTFDLAADTDVRQWTVAEVLTGEGEACTVAQLEDPVMQRLLFAKSARRPIVCEVPADHPYWLQSKGVRPVLGKAREASRPILLLRQGALPPAPPQDHREVTWTATWSVGAPEKVDVPQRNVMALRPGTTKKDEYVVVSAHYDHVGVGSPVDGDRIYNGADDDATGTTAVILIAEALAKMPPTARSVLFVCFTGEERGLLGSKAFCERPPVPLDKVVANVNLEMLGRPEEGKAGQAWITGHDLSDFAAIAGPALQRRGVELVEFPMAGRLFAASDNWSFVQKGVVAHSISGGSLHKDYHQPGDQVDKLDLPHMTKVIGAVLEFTRELADRDAAPQWNDKGRERLQRGKR